MMTMTWRMAMKSWWNIYFCKKYIHIYGKVCTIVLVSFSTIAGGQIIKLELTLQKVKWEKYCCEADACVHVYFDDMY